MCVDHITRDECWVEVRLGRLAEVLVIRSRHKNICWQTFWATRRLDCGIAKLMEVGCRRSCYSLSFGGAGYRRARVRGSKLSRITSVRLGHSRILSLHPQRLTQPPRSHHPAPPEKPLIQHHDYFSRSSEYVRLFTKRKFAFPSRCSLTSFAQNVFHGRCPKLEGENSRSPQR